MDKHYDPKAIEAKWYSIWMERGLFHGDADQGGEPYCVMIPPPNVTGILHMGHALNNTIQDIMARWRRMQGRNVVWMPGTDHAGIATQNVVERALKKEGKTREDLGREAFIERIWQWREEYGSTIVNQLKCLGASCDWERERFTMDEGLSASVSEVFCRLYDKGLIYRGNYIVNWCPRCQTALSDEESEHQETQGKLYYIKYPVAGTDQFVTVATTRPETMLGDVAVAVHPEDARYADLPEKGVILPILDRALKVVRDDYVDPAFGTGAVKITPAHDPNDFEMGRRHDLTPINVMNGDGTMNEEAGPYAGMDRFACRKQLIKDLEAAGLLEKIDEHAHAVGHCYRCDTVVEPRLSPQWFVKMKPLAEPALKVVQEGRVKFTPQRWENVYTQWLEGIRDWCISRQIWWGHRIPVFYCDGCNHEWAAREVPGSCPLCAATQIRQDEDVLDTWFSSWLWPFSTLGWPQDGKDLACYYPTHDLVTASEIIFFWVARMVMAGLEFMGDIPFSNVYIHGTVRDDQGRKMSKSLGNSIDPLSIIDMYSADALRASLIMITSTGQDVFLSNDKFEIGRNFGTKIWNAARFMKMHMDKTELDWYALAHTAPAFDGAALTSEDIHILAKIRDAVAETTDNLERFRFQDAALVLYDMVWHQYCDRYVEYAKQSLYGEDAARRDTVLQVMTYVFSSALKLLHPLMPFVTEEIWHAMGYGTEEESIMVAAWPEVPSAAAQASWGITDPVVTYVEEKHELIRAGRTLRADYNLPPSRELNYRISAADTASAEALQRDLPTLKSLLRAAEIEIGAPLDPDGPMPSGVCRMGTIYMPLEGVVDASAEVERLQGQLDKVAKDMRGVDGKLSNENFVSRAPDHVVEQVRTRRGELVETAAKLMTLLETMTSIAAGSGSK